MRWRANCSPCGCMAIRTWLSKPGNRRRRAVVDRVGTILDRKESVAAWTIAPDATVYDAIAEMALRNIGALLVTASETNALLGIITERDYARRVILKNRPSRQTRVRDIMTPSPMTVPPETTVDVCMRIMTQMRVRYLPVLANGKLVGIVSIGDLVNSIMSAQSYTIEQLYSSIVRP